MRCKRAWTQPGSTDRVDYARPARPVRRHVWLSAVEGATRREEPGPSAQDDNRQ